MVITQSRMNHEELGRGGRGAGVNNASSNLQFFYFLFLVFPPTFCKTYFKICYINKNKAAM